MLCVYNLLVIINKLLIFQLLVKKKRKLHPYFEALKQIKIIIFVYSNVHLVSLFDCTTA